ncbi:triphosphoribosyl-dephospho-CoA synthase [Aquisphaera giovannonii]|uniref:Triphosphoribosyl-dephospho-CoA synthase n=1 Tax=Aquisphaera giovannonii TaxID=406548 RepID=A0A5B9WBT0_9BACT|nr:triphosphoribosyl-dephospho-CoA synthase [Aquisphaera giovannonii]QEH37340.1 triphosphoribosyl-dephospho-CoA synthase [Aquisphaera giovannonii]
MTGTGGDVRGGPASSLSVGRLAEIACILEVSARKPGNVHPGASFRDLHHLDFLLSAGAIAGPLDEARHRGVGRSILAATEATRRVVRTNTNLGIILLLAPLAAVPAEVGLAEGIESVLAATTVEDARAAYRAIRLAMPGGLGRAAEQDVADEPTATLREVMSLAADRDLIARQYADGFREVLSEAAPMLSQAVRGGSPLEPAIVGTFLGLLARHEDTLIVRKAGRQVAAEASRKAGAVLEAGGVGTAAGRERLAELDAWLRAEGSLRNPGATADLVTAALFAALRDGTIPLPRDPGPAGWSGD